jgi:hypothetical protein
MAAIKKKYPELANRLTHVKDDYSVRAIPTMKPPLKTLVVKQGEQEWLLHSKEDPRGEAKAFADNVLSKDITSAHVLIMLGVGMGYYLDAVFSRYAKDMPFIIIVENNIQIFDQFIRNQRPMVVVDGKEKSIFEYEGCSCLVDVPLDQVYASLYDRINVMGKNSFATFYYVEHPILIRFNKQYYKSFCSEVSRVCFDIKSSYGNDPEDSWFGIDNMLQNLDLISSAPGVIKAKDAFKGKPAVIVATGPSLNKNIDLLPAIKDKCVFFAADASLNTFFKHDPPIIPDIVCSLERNLTTCNHFKQIDNKDMMKGIWLGACPVVKPHVYNEWHGEHMVVFRDFAHFKWLKLEKGILNTGKSVTNMAFKVAEYMGCDPIILVGQDLAFAPDGESHVRGADHAAKGLKDSQLVQQRAKVMGNNGQMLESLETWVGMLKRFEFDIATKSHEYKVINATEGGARINGTVVMDLKDVIDKYIKEDIDTSNKLKALLQYPNEEEKGKDQETIDREINRGLDYLEWSIKELTDVLASMDEGCALLDKEKIDPEVTQIFDYANKVKDGLLKHDMCYFTIMHVIQSWCMGRENILKSLTDHYKGDELIVARYLKIFEFFFGLLKLYKHVYEGTTKNYKSIRVRAEA